MHAQPVVVDARGHMLGRLASILAKQLLTGQYVVSMRIVFLLVVLTLACGYIYGL